MKRLGIALLSLMILSPNTLAITMAEAIVQEINAQVEGKSSQLYPTSDIHYTFLIDTDGDRDFDDINNKKTVSVGGTLSYRLVVENMGNKDLNNTKLTFQLPPNIDYYFSSTTLNKDIKGNLDQNLTKDGRSDKKDEDSVTYNEKERKVTIALGNLKVGKKAYAEIRTIVMPNTQFGSGKVKVTLVGKDMNKKVFEQSVKTESISYPKASDHYFIVDLSSSMNEKIGEKTKATLTREALMAEVKSFKKSDEVALRIHGAKNDPIREDSCKSSSRVFSYSGFNAKSLLEGIKNKPALGPAPLALSLERALVDVNKQEKVSQERKTHYVTLISDGKERCGGKTAEAALRLLTSDSPIIVNTIGFKANEKGRKNLQKISEITGGTYKDAK